MRSSSSDSRWLQGGGGLSGRMILIDYQFKGDTWQNAAMPVSRQWFFTSFMTKSDFSLNP
jgi:hypothetical protein